MDKKYLIQIIRSFRQEKISKLRKIGARLARKGALTESHALLQAGSIAYALSKLLQHEYPKELWTDFKKEVVSLLEGVDVASDKSMDETFEKVLDLISAFDRRTGKFSWNLAAKARANKATTAYAAGVSAGQAARLSGVSEWEVLSYAGKTRLPDELGISKDLVSRLENARKVFR